jgi:hypothetical protein
VEFRRLAWVAIVLVIMGVLAAQNDDRNPMRAGIQSGQVLGGGVPSFTPQPSPSPFTQPQPNRSFASPYPWIQSQ